MLIKSASQEAQYGYISDFLLHGGTLCVLEEVILMSIHIIPFSIKKKRKKEKKITLNYLKPMRFFQGTQERVRNSRGKRPISVRAPEVLL